MLEIIQNVLDEKLLDAINMNADTPSPSQSIEGLTCYAIQFYWTGFSGTALIATQASNDQQNWSTVDSFVPSGSTNSNMLNVEKAGYKFIRVSYTQTGGAGTLTAHVSGKVI